MISREVRFIKALVDSGAVGFKAAAELEAAREEAAAAGSNRPVWDLAVEKGLVSVEQCVEILGKLDPDEPGADAKAAKQELGNFELMSRLGQGGMGTVYKARQKSMDRIVALKILPRSMARNQGFIDRFLREARAAGKLVHPNIVTGIDAGVVDGYYYFAMEYVEGRNLGDRVRADGPMSEGEVLEIGRQIADALAYAHNQGLIHRDVKPENILLTSAGQAKLCDLGLARSTGSDEDLRVTQMGQAVGTPYYISPEQVRGEDPDARADIYSLGCTLYHLVSGRPPFQGSGPMATMQMHLNETAAKLSTVRSGISRALEAVVEKMMARRTADRYQTAKEVVEDFRKIAAGGVPAALSASLAGRRRGAAGLVTTRKGMGASTAATRPVGKRGARTALESPIDIGAAATLKTQPLAFVGGMRSWQLILLFAAGSVVAGVGGFFGIKWLRGRKAPEAPPSTAVVVAPEEDPLRGLREKLARADDYAAKHPGNFTEILLLYGQLVDDKDAKGTEIEATARLALEDVKKRQADELAAERLRLLEEEFDKARSFEAANPEKLEEILARYRRLEEDGRGTDIEAKVKVAEDAARKQHGERAVKLLADLDQRIGRECSAGRFRGALTAIDGFPRGYAAVVEADLAKLRERTIAAGRDRWAAMLEECRKLTAAGRFGEASTVAGRGRQLGVPGLDAEVSAALAEVDAARQAAEQAGNAAAEKAFGKYCEDLVVLAAKKQYSEARKRGERLAGTLTPALEARLRSELAVIACAEGFMKELRTGLRAIGAGQVKLPSPMGEGFLQSYDPAEDKLNIKVSVGNSSVVTDVEIADVSIADLLRLAAKAAGGELPAKSARGAACLLLTNGQAAGVRELLETARKNGENVEELLQRLSALEAAGGGAPAPATN